MKEIVFDKLKVFKILIFLGLAFGFCWTNYFNLMDFISGKETTSSTVVTVEKGLELPAITLCNKTAYKNVERNLKLKDYLRNTLDLTDFFVDILYGDEMSLDQFPVKVLNCNTSTLPF